MKVSDFIASYLWQKGIEVAFGYPGGMVTHLMESMEKHGEIIVRLCYHEQACAFAACGYSQTSGKVGMAFATSGPGATNLITGICQAYFESVPVLFITGQPNTFEAKGNMKVRQRGFQETDIVGMVKDVTKYASYITNPYRIKYEIDKALYMCKEGRPGPVLLDLPMNIQTADIDVESLVGFHGKENTTLSYYEDVKQTLIRELLMASRPVIIAGNGINMLNLRNEFREWLGKFGIPVLTTMIGVDLPDSSKESSFGFIGAYGNRTANMIVDQADLVITVGARLGPRQTGANLTYFAQNAKLVRMDIDVSEFDNRVKEDEIDILMDLRDFLPKAAKDTEFLIKKAVWEKWLKCCRYIQEKMEGRDNKFPNEIVTKVSQYVPDDFVVTTDVGQNQVWVAQNFCKKPGQRILFSGGHGSMGFSLPSAIGAYEASKRGVISFAGDGGFQMNIQELEYLAVHKIPIKVIILNNSSLGLIRQFQRTYFKDNFIMTTPEKGYGVPSFAEIAKAYGLYGKRVMEIGELDEAMTDFMADNTPGVLEIMISDFTYVYPKLIFKEPIYNQYPYLPSEVLEEILRFIKEQFSEEN